MTVNTMRYLLSLSLLAALVLTGCATYQYTQLDSGRAAKHYGTQPGYHRLSDQFSIEVDKRLTKFYYLGGPKGRKQLLGTIRTVWFDFSDYGPREIVYAISNDGKRLLFYDEPGVAQGKPAHIKNGTAVADLYSMDAGEDSKILLYRDVHRLGVSCVDFPRHFIRFGKVLPNKHIESIAFSTDSVTVLLEERRRRLYDSGNKHRVCGPL